MDLARYFRPMVYWRALCSIVNTQLLGRIERLYTARCESDLRHPPVFIIGAPRSGSTLAVQVITEAFDFGYISNCHCAWFGAPALAERWFRPLANKPKSDYSSQQGRTTGNYSPSECGEWWYRFYRRRPPYVTLYEASPRKMRQFRRSVGSLIDVFDRPVLFKNLYASLRIQAIAHYMPESLFILIHRNEVDNAHSLLETRQKVFSDYKTWWSMEPPNSESLKKLPAQEQVIEQIRHIHTIIENDLSRAGVSKKKVFYLDYEQCCHDTACVLDDLALFFSANSCQVERIGTPPRRFTRRRDVRIDTRLFAAVKRYANDD